ncbi:MAG: DegT/DnrJ/EryC1/StrS family aminotransferase [Bacteroidetes bacterium]|nr:DegT/DnrJ/EryC1/StrS family aminotransferase [Bacteroidota bacterium]
MIPFSPPRIDQRIIDEVTAALQSGWITTGPRTKLFEKKLSEYTGAPATLCLNSATAGLEVILRWYGVGPGDEVILPAYTYAATANVVIHCGATPVFVDVRADDFCIDVEAAANAITPRTKVIMPVDIGGFPADYTALTALAESRRSQFAAATDAQQQLGRILILGDAAHSIGAFLNGIPAGRHCDISCFSFHAVKNLTTAEGGSVNLNLPAPFDNEALYKWLCMYTLHGQTKDALAKMQKGNWRYDIVEAGYKCNMTDLQAAIGLVELERYTTDTLVRRREIFDRYINAFSQYSWAQLPVFERGSTVSSYHLFLLRIKGITEAQRDAIIQRIFDADVSVNVHYVPVPMMTFYKNKGYNVHDYPVTYDNYAREISLPVYYDLTNEQVDTVVRAVANAVAAETGIHG